MDNLDALKPMAIKSISTRVADEITEAARTSTPRATVGQLIERVWADWKGQGSPQQVKAPPIGELASLLHATAALAASGVPIPREVRALISDIARAGRQGLRPGLPLRSASVDAPKQIPED